MNTLKVGLQNRNDRFLQHKALMFTEAFSAGLEFKSITFSNQKMNIYIHCYNQQKELCITITRELFWFDYTSWETIAPPKKMLIVLFLKMSLGKLGSGFILLPTGLYKIFCGG
jgi:hypothetical protein